MSRSGMLSAPCSNACRDRSATVQPIVPTPGELEVLRDVEGNWMGALGSALERVRSRLTHRFLALDGPLERTFTEAKSKVLKAIRSAGLNLSEPLVGATTVCRLGSIGIRRRMPFARFWVSIPG